MPCSRTPIRKKVKPSQKDPPVSLLHPATSHLSSGDSLADAGAALPRAKVGVLANNGLRLLDGLLGLGEDELDVAGVGHVRVDLRQVSFVVFRRLGIGKRTRP